MKTRTEILKNQITQTARKRSSDKKPPVHQPSAVRMACPRTTAPAVKQTKKNSCSGQGYCRASHAATATMLRIPAAIQTRRRLVAEDSKTSRGKMKVAPRQATK